MMGDREKCIQAQMDEYLSKPLQQNQLIQTILKCATLGGPLLEKNRERELALQAEAKSSSNKSSGNGVSRPGLESRSQTTREPLSSAAMESPSLDSLAQEDPMKKARFRQDLSDMRSLSN